MTDRDGVYFFGGLVCQNPKMNVVLEPIQNQTTEELLAEALTVIASLDASRRASFGFFESAYWVVMDALALAPLIVAAAVLAWSMMGWM